MTPEERRTRRFWVHLSPAVRALLVRGLVADIRSERYSTRAMEAVAKGRQDTREGQHE